MLFRLWFGRDSLACSTLWIDLLVMLSFDDSFTPSYLLSKLRRLWSLLLLLLLLGCCHLATAWLWLCQPSSCACAQECLSILPH